MASPVEASGQTPGSANAATETNDEKPNAEQNGERKSEVTEDQWGGMQEVLQNIYAHRTEDGHDPSKVFHRKPNSRFLPDYYDVIKEPIALSTIKAKLNTRQYEKFPEFVRDFALVPHNAQVYNRSDAGAYQDALDIQLVLEVELKKLVQSKVVTVEEATLPYLGEIPAQDDISPVGEGDDDEDEEDDEESDDSTRPRKRGPGRPRRGSVVRGREDAVDERKRRGRPPRVDTPFEARIKNILKALKKHRDANGDLPIRNFERLPDKTVMPEYYNEIQKPMAVDTIKRKLKRKKYNSVEQFLSDTNIMFENAKSYNEDNSAIFNDAVELQEYCQSVAEVELKRPDSDFAMEDGRLPLPNGVEHNGELWKVGDWVHIQNANDLTKPIVAQIYRTWLEPSGAKHINACWYYRPEQTVHRFDRHFLENEVMKTGQYRDHQVEEIVDRCFVMFITRYNKGRPRDFPQDKEVYVCEARYNEDKHTFNKIKTWASCLPDEVRDQDYEMELFQEPRKMKKLPSPIAYLLKDDQKETDDFPKPQWGADNAPPKIGAVHRRPRDVKDSPPPQPTPEPTSLSKPQMPSSNVNLQSINSLNSGNSQIGGSVNALNSVQRPPTLSNLSQVNNTPQQRPLAQNNTTNSSTLRQNSNQKSTSNMQASQVNKNANARAAQPNASSLNANAQNRVQTNTAYPNTTYQTPQPIEVWHLQDAANAAIPPDIREQFQCDENGHVLFFTNPPLETEPQKSRLQHTARYLAAKERRRQEMAGKRKQEGEEDQRVQEQKRKRLNLEQENTEQRAMEMRKKSFDDWLKWMRKETEEMYQRLYGPEWEEKMNEAMETSLEGSGLK
ncbi:MAG: hypothetical protein M1831_006493 [Alyxoria varia]|nr:MAG: hypothetical protein M1831_006493 [Alyxoria varia]